jgi:AMMECR1 domain-containing protein
MFRRRSLYQIKSLVVSQSVSHDLPYLARSPSFALRTCTGMVDGMKTPQELSREAIDEFKAAYKDEFGEELSDDEVREIAMRLLRFFGILSKEK